MPVGCSWRFHESAAGWRDVEAQSVDINPCMTYERSALEPVDYFSNHRNKLRFPWRLYHAPVIRALTEAVLQSPADDALNVGSGPFIELSLLPKTPHRWTVCDLDPRAIESARALHGDRIVRADVSPRGNALPYPSRSFSLVVAMDVIEHVRKPLEFVRELSRVLRPGGHLFVTTPNYGSESLKIIESTVLELIARLQGFSRKNLHPTRLNESGLRDAIGAVGLQNVDVRRLAFGWALAARARQTENPKD